MCGICGLWNLNGLPVDPKLLVKMRDIMSYRGPDGYGCVLLDSKGSNKPFMFQDIDSMSASRNPHSAFDIGFGHRRLSIIDLNTGDQPMCNEDGSIWIVFNGEIYNYRELRQELLAKGHIFRTESDTEVIIHAYEEYGEECATRFNGIFAFAIWDARKRMLFLARDHFGVKPLYYSLHGGTFHFGSEIKTILCDPLVPREVDLDALNLCLTFRHTPAPWTLFRGIRKLLPGCFMTVNGDGFRESSYHNGVPVIHRSKVERQWVDELRDILEQAVARQMVSDVPIGISLSGGVDSGTLLAIISRHSNQPVRTYTVDFEGTQGTNEIYNARQRAKAFGAEFNGQVITEQDYFNFMDSYIWHLEEPVGNESAAACYFVAKMARNQEVKVLLNGQGPDETFAGYGRYLGLTYGSWLNWLGPVARRWLSSVIYMLPLSETWYRLAHMLEGADQTDQLLNIYSIIDTKTKASLFQPYVWQQTAKDLPRQYVELQYAKAPEGTSLEKMTYVDARTSLPDNLLLVQDKMGMAASVEVRVPYLDVKFMEIAERIPGRFKLSSFRGKRIHKKVCEKWLPHEVVHGKKFGFDTAMDVWLKQKLGGDLSRHIALIDSLASNYLNKKTVNNLISEQITGRRNHNWILFILYSLEVWYKLFIRGDPSIEIAGFRAKN